LGSSERRISGTRERSREIDDPIGNRLGRLVNPGLMSFSHAHDQLLVYSFMTLDNGAWYSIDVPYSSDSVPSSSLHSGLEVAEVPTISGSSICSRCSTAGGRVLHVGAYP
jgi:hypothetical protein